MQWSTTVSLHDLHIIDDANSIVRWHRMSQCPVCLQPIPYDERRLISGKVLHSGCIICVECHKSIGDGAFEQRDEDIFCVSCYNNTIKIKKESSPTSITTTTTTTAITEDNDTSTSSAVRYGSMKSFIERVYLYNEYNQKKTSHLNIIQKADKMRVSGMLRIYWNINTPIKLLSGQSIPLGLYPKSLGIYEMIDEKLNNENDNDQQQSKNLDSICKRLCYDDTILTKLSLTDDNDPNQIVNLRRAQTIRASSNQRKTLRVTIPSFIQSSNDDDEARSFIPAKDSMTTVYIDAETTVHETISLLFSKHFIEESNSNLFALYKVESQNGNCIEMSDDDYPLILRILAGPFENDILFYLMEHGKSKTVPLEVSNYLVLPDSMLRAFIDKFSYEEVEQIHAIKRKYLAYKLLLLRQFEISINQS
ncbi:unnamed protein product [Rotaria socialis]|uniref:Uncharacterized protein n=2 Tax=Rotaria socialis TaxID=392032 RepID=A0A820AIL0_9BILA|nr:unnamed protein product [Rotaria socialis]CAF3374126.1 unnamed protein product [Rotaria socialis]CAF4191401.1 unnamed protein product [Rotaria socialis]